MTLLSTTGYPDVVAGAHNGEGAGADVTEDVDAVVNGLSGEQVCLVSFNNIPIVSKLHSEINARDKCPCCISCPEPFTHLCRCNDESARVGVLMGRWLVCGDETAALETKRVLTPKDFVLPFTMVNGQFNREDLWREDGPKTAKVFLNALKTEKRPGELTETFIIQTMNAPADGIKFPSRVKTSVQGQITKIQVQSDVEFQLDGVYYRMAGPWRSCPVKARRDASMLFLAHFAGKLDIEAEAAIKLASSYMDMADSGVEVRFDPQDAYICLPVPESGRLHELRYNIVFMTSLFHATHKPLENLSDHQLAQKVQAIQKDGRREVWICLEGHKEQAQVERKAVPEVSEQWDMCWEDVEDDPYLNPCNVEDLEDSLEEVSTGWDCPPKGHARNNFLNWRLRS